MELEWGAFASSTLINILDIPSRAVLIAFLVSCCLSLILIKFDVIFRSRPLLQQQLPLPPGPRSWPIFGSLLQAKGLQHQWFAQLALKYGPLIYLRFGSSLHLVVVSSPELAKEVLLSRDADFAFRPRSTFSDHIGYGCQNIVFRPCDEAWRHIRKTCWMSLFTPSALIRSAALRQQEICRMVAFLYSAAGSVVTLRSILYEINFNTTSRLLFGRRYLGSDQPHDPDTEAFLQAMKEIIALSGKTDMGDIFPALRWLDLQGIDRAMRYRVMPPIEKFYRARVAEHRSQRHAEQSDNNPNPNKANTFTDTIVSLKGEKSLSERTMAGILSDILLGGTDTNTITLEWAFRELLKKPEIALKAQKEIDSVVGRERLVAETDVQNLPYVQAIVNETFRLHPAFPLGIPHFNPSTTQIAGYTIPAGSTVLVNIWAIGRDPHVWINPMEFNPERFLGKDIRPKGQHFELLPFSAGRRQCLGYPLALVQLPLILATLLHAFNWSLPAGQRCEEVNMKERMGIACYPEAPVEASVSCRLQQEIYVSVIEQNCKTTE